MGACFGIALTLVIFAGSDLFTGHTLFMTVGLARGTSSWGALGRNWMMSWAGNLCGSVLLAIVFWLAGGGQVLKQGADLIYNASAAKMSAAPIALLARAALCNWLVCLAIWTSARATSDAAKCILIWWCLFAFIACGFEHSVANMTVFAVALLGDHPASVSLGGAAYNLLWVTLGNIVGGAGFVALAYLAASSKAVGGSPLKVGGAATAKA
jgi:nitrite transporter NirC